MVIEPETAGLHGGNGKHFQTQTAGILAAI